MIPTGPLERWLAADGRNIGDLIPDPSLRRAWYRALRAGQIAEPVADRIAISALRMPLEVIYDPADLEGIPA